MISFYYETNDFNFFILFFSIFTAIYSFHLVLVFPLIRGFLGQRLSKTNFRTWKHLRLKGYILATYICIITFESNSLLFFIESQFVLFHWDKMYTNIWCHFLFQTYTVKDRGEIEIVSPSAREIHKYYDPNMLHFVDLKTKLETLLAKVSINCFKNFNFLTYAIQYLSIWFYSWTDRCIAGNSARITVISIQRH